MPASEAAAFFQAFGLMHSRNGPIAQIGPCAANKPNNEIIHDDGGERKVGIQKCGARKLAGYNFPPRF